MHSIKPIQLQRLVDGELKLEEAQQLLRTAESNPELWRLIATSYVENQLWQSEFVGQLDGVSESSAIRTRQQGKAQSSSHVSRIQWMSLAASIALAISIGFLFGRNETGGKSETNGAGSSLAGLQDVSPEMNSDVKQLASNHLTSEADNLKLTPAVYHMQLEDQKGNQFMDSEIPLYPVSRNDDLRRLRQTEIPATVRISARESGYDVQQNVRYVSGRFNDGRRFVIPIRNYRFSPNQ